MREQADGSWEIKSAFEAVKLGMVAAIGSQDGSGRYFFRHRHYLGSMPDEVEFFNRTLKYGELVISRHMAERIEAGLLQSVMPRLPGTPKPDNLLPAEEAQIFLDVLALSRQAPHSPAGPETGDLSSAA